MDRPEVTRYLEELKSGDRSAVDRLLPLVYEDLRRMAQGIFRERASPRTLQPTVLVHEAYVRLVDADSGWENREHFFSVAAIAMRQLLSNYARDQAAQKRGGNRERVVLAADAQLTDEEEGLDLVALDDALSQLAELDERQARIVELRFLAGLSVEETAKVLGVSERTVYLDWQMARSWLARALA